MKAIKDMRQNHEMGFITNMEFLNEIVDELSFIGAQDVLIEKMNECVQPLVDYMKKIMDDPKSGSIKDFKLED